MTYGASFLQSDAWERFNQAMGHKTWRLGGVLVIKIAARRGTFLLVPHAQKIPDGIVELGKKERCDFIRICPLIEDTVENRLLFKQLTYRNAPAQMHPIHSSILDITKSESELLAGMRKTTRYSIRKAEKDGVVVTQENTLERFWEVYQATVHRQNFTPFSKEFLQNEFEILDTVLFFAHVDGRTVAAAMIVFTPEAAYYHHGASLADHPTASYLLQWRAIQEAKRRGCGQYNFWGVVRDEQTRHPWYGLSQFKKGFGGFAETYVPAQDLVLSPLYWISYGIETLRRMKRGL